MSSTGEWSDAGRGLSRDGVDEERVSEGRAGGSGFDVGGLQGLWWVGRRNNVAFWVGRVLLWKMRGGDRLT